MSFEPPTADGERTLNRYSAVGAFFVLCYSVLSAAKEVIIGHAVQDVNPNVLVFLSFGFTLIIFNAGAVLNFRLFARRWRFYADRRTDLLLLNVETGLAWGCFFWAVRYLEPAVVSAVTVGLSPLFSQIFSADRDSGVAIAAKVILSSIVSACLLVATFLGFSAVGLVDRFSFVFGAILCMFGALAISLVTSRTRRLYQAGCNALDLMRTRFLILVGISGLAASWSSGVELDTSLIATSAVIAVFGIALPLFALQKGLEDCSATMTLLIISSAPGFTLLFQMFDPRLDYSLATVAAVGTLFAISVWSVFSQELAARR
jgi:drug/metabolite transporter (DMT)-like permease